MADFDESTSDPINPVDGNIPPVDGSNNQNTTRHRYNDKQIAYFLMGRFNWGNSIEQEFGKEFFERDFYYLLMHSFIREMHNDPLTVREAIRDCMKLEDRTGTNRIRRAIDAGLLEQKSCSSDKRKRHIVTTDLLKEKIRKTCAAGIDESRQTIDAVASLGALPPFPGS